MLTIPPLALYIHIPWCIRKCPYCDFNSHAVRDSIPETQYIDTLLQDLALDLQQIDSNRPLISIFIGGGTPSLFSATSIEKLLAAINKKLNWASDIEITMEANPGTVEYERFAGYRSAGVNRLSIGIQSFQKNQLKNLGRIHDDQEAIKAAETAHKAGFNNFNLDLMFGLPDQTIADALFDLKTALALSPSHLSWYQLTIEPNTFFAYKPPVLPEDEKIWEMQEQGCELLAQHGFRQYEISAYSLPEKNCRHNRNYWEFGDYLGIGAGAHSKITDIAKNIITRSWKIKNPRDYLAPHLALYSNEQTIKPIELPFEFMLNALRLYQDIPIELFEQRTGLPITTIETQLNLAQTKGLLYWDQNTIRPTELGRRFYNNLVEIFIVS